MTTSTSKLDENNDAEWDVVIVGAGPAGLGTAYAMTHFGITNRFVILERHHVGASFDRWPNEMRFITPSFNSNQFGWLDLNSFGLRISPALSIGAEHPTGKQYADFLRSFAQFLQLPVRNGCDVKCVTPQPGGGFLIDTSLGTVRTKFVVWAAGEFQYPNRSPFPGAEHCVHNSQIGSYADLDGDEFVIVGGYESGMDAAVNLVRSGAIVTVLDATDVWNSEEQDPSVSLSTYTRERVVKALKKKRLKIVGKVRVEEVIPKQSGFLVRLDRGGEVVSPTPPILATGFVGSLTLVRNLFDWDGNKAQLTTDDESTKTPGLFLVGPAVWHDQVIFCFIYKYRQRFAIVCDAIAQRLGHDTAEARATYRSKGMYLDDLSCCKESCETC